VADVRIIDNEYVECTKCGSSDVDRIDCDRCGGEGFIDGYELMEEDPCWYGPDDVEMCTECDSTGGWWVCFTCQRAAQEADAKGEEAADAR